MLAVLAVPGCLGEDVAPSSAASDDGGGVGSGDGGGALGADGGGGLAPDAAPSAACPCGCLPPAPAGWTGPSATYDGTPDAKPAECAAPYTKKELDAHQGMKALAPTCGCGTAAFAGGKCDATLAVFAQAGCTDPLPTAAGSGSSSGPCFTSDPVSGSFAKLRTTLAAGTCSYPNPVKTIPAPTFDKVQVACGLPQAAACEGRSDCVATPAAPAAFTRLCIHKDGDESCPSADYPNRTVAFKRVDDGRACSACSGVTAGGACGTMFGYSANLLSCGTVAPTNNVAANTCMANPGSKIVNLSGIAPTGIACTPTGGQPSGAAASADTVTFCCNR
jgi:hypothetical protein